MVNNPEDYPYLVSELFREHIDKKLSEMPNDLMEKELLSNLVYGLGRVPVRLFHYLFTILELNIVDHEGQQIKSSNPLPAPLRCF